MDNDTGIVDVIGRAPCRRHRAGFWDPCWWIWPMSGLRKKPAICNQRALNAGFVGEIDPRSLRKR